MVSTQIINAVRNYTDDALIAIQRTGKANTTRCGNVVAATLENSNGVVSIFKNAKRNGFTTTLKLNNGDFFERTIDNDFNLAHQKYKIQAITSATLGNDINTSADIEGGQAVFKLLLHKLLR